MTTDRDSAVAESVVLPCPFCGEQPTRSDRTEDRRYSPTGHVWFIACFCGGHSARAHQHGHTEAEVIERWNRRTPRSATQTSDPLAHKAWPFPTRPSTPPLTDAAKRDIDLTEAAHDLLVACDMEQHNEDIFKGKWKKGSKAWSGKFIAEKKADAIARLRKLVPPTSIRLADSASDSTTRAKP